MTCYVVLYLALGSPNIGDIFFFFFSQKTKTTLGEDFKILEATSLNPQDPVHVRIPGRTCIKA
jgi:hypothetical protein